MLPNPRRRLSLLTLSVVVSLPILWLPVACDSTAAAERSGLRDPVARGRYLVNAIGCGDCHTPLQMGPNGPTPDLTRLLSGHPESLVLPEVRLPEGPWVWAGAATNTAFAGPWGVSYAINLTPDASGLAAWTEDTFLQAMRTGKHFGVARPILPPMPWHAIGQLTEEDLRAIFAYLQSIPKVVNHVPDPLLAPGPGGADA